MTTTGPTKLYIPVRHEQVAGEGSTLLDGRAHFDRATAKKVALSSLRATGVDVTDVMEVWLAEDEIPALTELREAVTALHAYLYPERYPRELQPDHAFWQEFKTTEEARAAEACYEWRAADDLEAVADILDLLVADFPKPPPPPKDYTMPGTTSELVLTLLTNELESAEEDLRDAETNRLDYADDARNRRDQAQEALDAFRSQFS